MLRMRVAPRVSMARVLLRSKSTLVAESNAATFNEIATATAKAFPDKDSNPTVFRQYEAKLKQELAAKHLTFFPANPEAANELYETYVHTKEHAQGTGQLWKRISIWVFIPALIATTINTYFVELKHAEHRAHVNAVPEDERPAEMEFQNIRTKDFFWGDGDKTLFWNDAANHHKRA